MRRKLRPLLLLASLGVPPALPAAAESQSSDQGSNCSNGRCTRVDTRRYEDDRGRSWGWQRVERWDERRRAERPRHWDPQYGYAPAPRRRGRDRDDDD